MGQKAFWRCALLGARAAAEAWRRGAAEPRPLNGLVGGLNQEDEK